MNTYRYIFISVTSIFLLLLTNPAFTAPVTALFSNDARCDAVADQTLTHELGSTVFPVNELISASAIPGNPVCTSDGNPANDWEVTITNLSSSIWKDLFFVADANLTLGNADGMILGGDAFRIDSTGTNANLLSESILADGLFVPGESWIFLVTDFSPPIASSPPPVPLFGSIGVGLFSQGTGILLSTASIVANPVPVPAAVWLFGSAIGLLGWIRHRVT